MGNTSTFGTFTMARLGIYVAQHALTVTGNNISNINTKGYSRQQLDQSSMYFGGADRYQSRYDIRENGGVLAKGVGQMRDMYLDIRYRNEMTRVGESDAKLDGLRQLGVIFDEVAKGKDGEGVLEARFNDLVQQLEEMLKDQNAGNDDIDALVRSSAEALAVQFNSYAKQLETLKANETAQFKQDLDETNATLEKIRDLNETIRKTQIFGGSGLTLKDERNLLIDKLSEKIGINVIYETEDLGDGVEVEKLKITTSGEPPRTLIDGIYGAKLSILQKGEDVPRLDKDGNPVIEDGLPVYDKQNMDVDNYDLVISRLFDSRGKQDPTIVNKTEQVISDFKVLEGERNKSIFQTEDEANKVAALLNNDSAYTRNPNDPSKGYYYHVAPISNEPGAPYTIHFHETKLDADGKPIGPGNPEYVENPYSYIHVEAPEVTKLSDTELRGSLQAMRELLTESGEYTTANDPKLQTDDPLHYDSDAGSKRGIPYYQKALDNLANTFANLINNANTLYGDSYVDTLDKETLYLRNKDGDFIDKNGNKITDPDTQNYVLKDEYKKYYKQDENGNFLDRDGNVTEDPTKFVSIDGYHDLQAIYQQDESGMFVDADGNPLSAEDQKDETKYVLKEEYRKYFQFNVDANGNETDPVRDKNGYLILRDEYRKYHGGPLFSSNGNSNDPTGITAANISISNDWAHGRNHVLRSKEARADEASRLQDNVRHIITVMGSKHVFENTEGTGSKFEGTFQEMLTDTISGTLAKDQNITETMLENYNTTADEIYVDRDAVMGVDLNDEAMNMMQFQKAYSAACRLMTTYDTMLEKLINGTAM